MVKIRQVFLIRERRHLIVQLTSFDWDFTLGKSVELICGEISVRARQIGSGNHQGFAVVELQPQEPWEQAESKVRKLLESGAEPFILVSGAP